MPEALQTSVHERQFAEFLDTQLDAGQTRLPEGLGISGDIKDFARDRETGKFMMKVISDHSGEIFDVPMLQLMDVYAGKITRSGSPDVNLPEANPQPVETPDPFPGLAATKEDHVKIQEDRTEEIYKKHELSMLKIPLPKKRKQTSYDELLDPRAVIVTDIEDAAVRPEARITTFPDSVTKAQEMVDRALSNHIFRSIVGEYQDSITQGASVVDMVRTNQDFRNELGRYLYGLFDRNIEAMPERVYRGTEKSPNYPNYPDNMQSRDVVVLFALEKLSGTWNYDNMDGTTERDPSGDIIRGQYRAASDILISALTS